jgi:HAD superfamily 5'-nucleotidase-like hydrolase
MTVSLFCNRTLNLRAIQAIGYDMDYTLIHYDVHKWEEQAYKYLKEQFLNQGWPVEHLTFDPNLVRRGLIIDKELGNIVKSNRFGFIKQAIHGTNPIAFEKLRDDYQRTIVDLNENRWVFLNTFFSLSEGCFYAQLVDLLDQGKLPEAIGYTDLYTKVIKALDAAHTEGRLKAEILANPEMFVELNPDIPLALLDQKHAGKKLMLITNSEWQYTQPIMNYAFNRFLPEGMTWRDIFDVVIVSARKPSFFTTNNAFFEFVTEDGLLKPTVGGLKKNALYYGGSAGAVEKFLGLTGDEILYVGDHVFGDVLVTKSVLRWRTALILRELDEEVTAAASFKDEQEQLSALMLEKEGLEARSCGLRVQLQRLVDKYGPQEGDMKSIQQELGRLKTSIEALDHQIAPLAKRSSELGHPFWGPLMRTGNDKSHLAFQVERYADVYTSKVAHFLQATPFMYLRSPRGTLPHD